MTSAPCSPNNNYEFLSFIQKSENNRPCLTTWKAMVFEPSIQVGSKINLLYSASSLYNLELLL